MMAGNGRVTALYEVSGGEAMNDYKLGAVDLGVPPEAAT
jgi:hypothetical protein